MAKLLYIQASPQGKRSMSMTAADAFVEAYQEKNPRDQVLVLNVFQAAIPSFDGLTVEAKYAILHGKPHTDEQMRVWKNVEQLIERFKSADKYVLAVPMWNFGIPYKLKQYIDVLVQPGYTFSYNPKEGYKGLVTGKPVLAVYARGGEYENSPDGQAADMQKKYIELIFGFMGFTDFRSVIIEPTLEKGEAVAKQKCNEAIEQLKKIAEEF